MYVACTRAKRRLHLTTHLKFRSTRDGTAAWRPPPSRTPLARMWPALAADLAPPPGPAGPATAPGGTPGGSERPAPRAGAAAARLVAAAVGAAADRRDAGGGRRGRLPFDWAREVARHVGHGRPPPVRARSPPTGSRPGTSAPRPCRRLDRRRAALAGAGGDALPAPFADVQLAVRGVLADDRGRWLFAPRTMTRAANGRWRASTAGRSSTWCSTAASSPVGVRWIVDFKTGGHEGGDTEAFLDAEACRATRPPCSATRDSSARWTRGRCGSGCTIPRLAGWREWTFDPTAATDEDSRARDPVRTAAPARPRRPRESARIQGFVSDGATSAGLSRAAGRGGPRGRADDRQFRRRSPRASGDARAAHRGRRRSRAWLRRC